MNIDRKKFKEDLDQFIGNSSLFTEKDKSTIKNRLEEKNRRRFKIAYPIALTSVMFLLVILLFSSRYFIPTLEQEYTANDFIEIGKALNISIENKSSFGEIIQLLGNEYTPVTTANESVQNNYMIRYDFIINPSFTNPEIYDFLDPNAVKSGDLAGQIILSFNQHDQLYSFSMIYLNQRNEVELLNNHNGKTHNSIIGEE